MNAYQEKMDKKMLENATKLEALLKRLADDIKPLGPEFSRSCAEETLEGARDVLGTMIADLRFG